MQQHGVSMTLALTDSSAVVSHTQFDDFLSGIHKLLLFISMAANFYKTPN